MNDINFTSDHLVPISFIHTSCEEFEEGPAIVNVKYTNFLEILWMMKIGILQNLIQKHLACIEYSSKSILWMPVPK